MVCQKIGPELGKESIRRLVVQVKFGADDDSSEQKREHPLVDQNRNSLERQKYFRGALIHNYNGGTAIGRMPVIVRKDAQTDRDGPFSAANMWDEPSDLPSLALLPGAQELYGLENSFESIACLAMNVCCKIVTRLRRISQRIFSTTD
jgi:hypothetical protein